METVGVGVCFYGGKGVGVAKLQMSLAEVNPEKFVASFEQS